VAVGARVRVRALEGHPISAVKGVPDESPIAFERAGDSVQFDVPPFDGLMMCICETA
jgi:hypothetical protein